MHLYLLDVDECNNNNGDCEQICKNIPGAHTCGCNTGYNLQTDGQTCIGTDAHLHIKHFVVIMNINNKLWILHRLILVFITSMYSLIEIRFYY